MAKPNKPQVTLPALRIDEQNSAFVRDLERLKKTRPNVGADLEEAYKDFRAAYKKVQAGDQVSAHANQNGFGSPLGDDCFKKRVASRDQHGGKSGGFRLIWKLNRISHAATPFMLRLRRDCQTLTQAEIDKARDKAGLKTTKR